MKDLANVLSTGFQTPTVDETGLDGRYNFSFQYHDPRFPDANALDTRDLLRSLQETLGLKLTRDKKHPVEYLVIDGTNLH